MNLGTHMPDGERRNPIDIEVCRSKVKVTLSVHMFATRLSHLWCVTDFSVISWRPVLLVEGTGVPKENHRPAASLTHIAVYPTTI